MPRRVWCSLCGVLITPVDDPSDEPLDWLADVRIVRTVDNRQEPWKDYYITGVGYLDTDLTVKAPLNPGSHSGAIKSEQDNVTHMIFGNSKRYWAFPFHNDCWELLRDRVGRDVEPNELAPHLFLYLYNMPIHDHERLMPGHDYGGADTFRFLETRTEYMYYSQIDASGSPFLYRAPDTCIQMDKHAIWETVESFAAPFKLPVITFSKTDNGAETEGFLALPNEVFILILTYLQNSDLCNLRLASRTVAQVTAPSQLPPAFWRSRFDPDFNMGFVFSGALRSRLPVSNTNWRDLYLHAQATLFERELFGGFENRQRIWLAIRHIARALRLRLDNHIRIQNEPYVIQGSQLEHSEQQGSWVSADAAVPLYPSHPLARMELTANCRVLEMHKMQWDTRNQAKILLKVAYVKHSGKRYVCGLSLSRRTSGTLTTDIASAGFTNSPDFQEFILEGNVVLDRMEVALCCTGILGLRFVFTRQNNDKKFALGDLPPPSQAVGFSELRGSKGRTITGLMFGLDAFKIVSISLVDEAVDKITRSALAHTNGTPTTMIQPAEVWTPAKPKLPVSWLFQNTDLTQLHDICLNMNFGGEDGTRLRHLVKVVAQIGRYPAVFVGMKFIYDDGTELNSSYHGDLLQYRTLDDQIVEQIFLIDGPGGEEINQITVSYSMEYGNIRKVSCHTNYDRNIDFGTHGGYKLQDTLSIKKIEADADSILTSFFTKVKMPGVVPSMDGQFRPEDHDQRGFFRNFAAASVPRRGSHLQKVADDQGNYFFAAADFTNLRRISVSVGEKTNTPGRKVITGLQLEYHDSKLPVIVGQWVEELGSFNITANDRIVELHIGIDTQENIFRSPISGIYLWTNDAHEAEFVSHHEASPSWRVFREDAYERLNGIVWGSNYKWDHVWSLIEPWPNVPRLILGWHPMDSTPCPTAGDTHLDKLFFDDARSEEIGDQIVSIGVGFWPYNGFPNTLWLVFKNGRTHVFGHERSCCRKQTAELEDGETLIGLEIGLCCPQKEDDHERDQLAYFKFTTSNNRTLDFREEWDGAKREARYVENHHHLSIIHHIPFTPEAAEIAAKRAARKKADIVTRTILGCLEVGCKHQGPQIRVADLPSGARRCVGLWAVNRAALAFPWFGPLFEGDVAEA